MKKLAHASFDWSSVNNAELAMHVEEGLPVLALAEFGRKVGFTIEELARLVHIPPRTYARRVASKARLNVPEGERAVRIMRLYDRAHQVLGSHERTNAWLNRKLRVLGNRTPLDFARTEPGAREVEAILERYEDGVFS